MLLDEGIFFDQVIIPNVLIKIYLGNTIPIKHKM